MRQQERLDAREEILGIRRREKESGFFRTLPMSAVGTRSRGGFEIGEELIEVEIGVDLVGQRDAIEINRDALRSAELAKHGAIQMDLRPLRCARLFERQ